MSRQQQIDKAVRQCGATIVGLRRAADPQTDFDWWFARCVIEDIRKTWKMLERNQ